MKKSYITSFILTLIIGPLGVFYSSMAGGIIMLAMTIGAAISTGPVAILMWPVSIAVGLITVSNHNARENINAERHQETLEAIAISGHGAMAAETATHASAIGVSEIRDMVINDDAGALAALLRTTDGRLTVIEHHAILLELADAYDSKLAAAAIHAVLQWTA